MNNKLVEALKECVIAWYSDWYIMAEEDENPPPHWQTIIDYICESTGRDYYKGRFYSRRHLR